MHALSGDCAAGTADFRADEPIMCTLGAPPEAMSTGSAAIG
jgi:hypothetical protein